VTVLDRPEFGHWQDRADRDDGAPPGPALADLRAR
jgi:hypothetical protein